MGKTKQRHFDEALKTHGFLSLNVAEKFGTRTPVGFCSRTPSVPRASIIWLAPAVKDTTKNGSNKWLAAFRSSLTAFAPPRDGT
jgi:hypothetical protein